MQRRLSVSAPSGRLTGIVGAALLTATLLATTSLTSSPARAEGKPEMSADAKPSGHTKSAFKPDPRYSSKDYDPNQQIQIYGGKTNIEDLPFQKHEQRPLVELGQKLYVEGPLAPNYDWFGRKNLASPAFSIFGDWRTAVAYNDNGPGKKVGQIATRLNLETDLEITSTERLHALFRPLDRNGTFTHQDFFGPDQKGGAFPLNGDVKTLFFEGDLGNMIAGATDKYQSFNLPFSVGLVPLIMQNGVWFNSAITGGAFSITAKNSPELGISNMDLTVFGGFDKVIDRQVYGAAAFVEANEGYWEWGVGGINDDRVFAPSSFQNATIAFTKRYGGWLSNSVRIVGTVGDDPKATQKRTKDGIIVLLENSLVSPKPLVLVPYLNMFAGFGRPQSLLRNADAGGILFNTGITFETDGLTGFPKMDDTGQDTYGGAIGLEYLFDFEQQIVVEASTVQVINGNLEPGRTTKAPQYGVGARYQRNLTKAWLFRADVVYAVKEQDNNVAGIRTEVRLKF